MQTQLLAMRNKLFVFSLFVLFISCSQNPTIPPILSEKLPESGIGLTTKAFNTPVVDGTLVIDGVDQVYKAFQQYEERNTDFSMVEFQDNWKALKADSKSWRYNSMEISKWINSTGLLLQLTGETKYADELERLILQQDLNGKDEILPYVFTKNTDHLFTNVYFPSKIEYDHTLGGKVELEMVTDYPKSGKVDLKFAMTQKRYIELNIRIPEWAKGTTVIVKKVKYIAAPGTYCKIAKKWKQGDLVEIQFPEDKIPGELNNLLVEN